MIRSRNLLLLLSATLLAASIMPAPIQAQGPSVFATGFHNSLPLPNRKGGISMTGKPSSS
jgi:hypothetical protein